MIKYLEKTGCLNGGFVFKCRFAASRDRSSRRKLAMVWTTSGFVDDRLVT